VEGVELRPGPGHDPVRPKRASSSPGRRQPSSSRASAQTGHRGVQTAQQRVGHVSAVEPAGRRTKAGIVVRGQAVSSVPNPGSCHGQPQQTTCLACGGCFRRWGCQRSGPGWRAAADESPGRPRPSATFSCRPVPVETGEQERKKNRARAGGCGGGRRGRAVGHEQAFLPVWARLGPDLAGWEGERGGKVWPTADGRTVGEGRQRRSGACARAQTPRGVPNAEMRTADTLARQPLIGPLSAWLRFWKAPLHGGRRVIGRAPRPPSPRRSQRTPGQWRRTWRVAWPLTAPGLRRRSCVHTGVLGSRDGEGEKTSTAARPGRCTQGI